ncbi:MAG: saccharopine dehydrogenase NADP-binding domain-containing protein [Acidobacteriota bacterium]
MKIVVLGGYGNTGIRISRLLAEVTDVDIVIAGRNQDKADRAAASIESATGGNLSGVRVEASDHGSLSKVLEHADLIIAATSGFDAESIINSAVATDTHYLDIYLSFPRKMEVLRSKEEEIIKKGLCFITDGGFHPGVPGAMVRMAGQKLPKMTKAEVGGSFSLNWSKTELSQSTRTEFLVSLCEMNISAFVQGEWKKSIWNLRKFDFGPQQGQAYCFPMYMEELRNLPEKFPALRDTGFYIAGFHPVFDYLVMPACMAAVKIFPGKADSISNFFIYSLKKMSKKEEWGILLLEAEEMNNGGRNTLQMRLEAPDPYDLTAIPVISCLSQFFQGLRTSGIHTQAEFVDPLPFFQEMEKMGVELQLKINGESLKLE